MALPPTPGNPDRRGIIIRVPVLVLQQMTSPAGLVDLVTITVIEGIGIDAGAQVLIDGVALPPADVVRESDRRLRVAMPRGKGVGSVTVVVVNPDGERVTVPGGFSLLSRLMQGPTTDADRDGLMDRWEKQLGLNAMSAADVQGGSGDPDGDGRTDLEEQAALSAPARPAPARRGDFAEGATGFFETRFSLLDPTTTEATVLLRFQRDDGTQQAHYVRVPGRQSRKVTVSTEVPDMARTAFSTVIKAAPIVADRQMWWTRVTAYGSHAETGVVAPARTWYLAEGATIPASIFFYLVQNPNPVPVEVRVRYLLPAGAPLEAYSYRPPAG